MTGRFHRLAGWALALSLGAVALAVAAPGAVDPGGALRQIALLCGIGG